ncbi:MAG: FlgB family protein [Paracoccaceae bacterium]|jgi:flagellar basal-body rod protein FlgB
MFAKSEILSMSAALAANAEARLSAVAENVANADTPGYRAKDAAPFAATYRGLSDFVLRATRPGHLGFADHQTVTATHLRPDGHMSPNGNNVSLEGELMRASIIRQDHDLALGIYKSALTILRTSLGRR